MTPIIIKSSRLNIPIEKISKISISEKNANDLVEAVATGTLRLETIPNVVEPNGLIDGSTLQYDSSSENWVANNKIDGGEF